MLKWSCMQQEFFSNWWGVPPPQTPPPSGSSSTSLTSLTAFDDHSYIPLCGCQVQFSQKTIEKSYSTSVLTISLIANNLCILKKIQTILKKIFCHHKIRGVCIIDQWSWMYRPLILWWQNIVITQFMYLFSFLYYRKNFTNRQYWCTFLTFQYWRQY